MDERYTGGLGSANDGVVRKGEMAQAPRMSVSDALVQHRVTLRDVEELVTVLEMRVGGGLNPRVPYETAAKYESKDTGPVDLHAQMGRSERHRGAAASTHPAIGRAAVIKRPEEPPTEPEPEYDSGDEAEAEGGRGI